MSEKDVEKLFPYYFFCTREDRLGPIIAKHTEVKVDGMMIRLCPESASKIVTDRDKAVSAIKKLAAWLEVIAPDLYDKFLDGKLDTTESTFTDDAKTIADLKVKLDFEVDDSELKKIKVQTSKDFLFEVIAAARKEGTRVEIQHMQVDDIARTTIVFPQEGE